MSTQQNELKAFILRTRAEGKPWPAFEAGQLARLNREARQLTQATAPPLTPTKQKPPPASEASG